MAKRFNTTVTCNPSKHYMVDITKKMKYVEGLIENAHYFTINRGRQFGKSTVLNWIYNNLSDRYYVVAISFETTSSVAWQSEEGFIDNVCQKIAEGFRTIKNNVPEYSRLWTEARNLKNYDDFSNFIKSFCDKADKPIILTIDEMDKSLDNQLFLNFLGMLRNRYLDRDKFGMNTTFYSVILAGVYDVKNLKLKIRPDEEKKYNSPWNVAVDFKLDMTFHSGEIAQMLSDYETDFNTGMDIKAISEEIYKFTSGYPFLVSKICQIIDEDINGDFSVENVHKAINMLLLLPKVTLFGSLVREVEDHPDLKTLLYNILIIKNKDINYEPDNPTIDIAITFSFVKRDEFGKLAVHNLIFEKKLINYLISIENIKGISNTRDSFYYYANGDLNMEIVLKRFQDLMHREYRDRDQKFIEQQGRLLFLCFLKPLINGSGFYYVEPQISENRRMDLMVTYNKKEYVIELKIWHGTQYETDGKIQLTEYLKSRNLSEGYLVTFSFLKNKTLEEPSWNEQNGKRIFEAII